MIDAMNTVPTDIRQAAPDRLAIRWADGVEHEFPVFDLRCACPCANCVDEMTGIRQLDPGSVPAGVRPNQVASVGNYAIKISWSDGHDSGIYSFKLLRRLGERAG